MTMGADASVRALEFGTTRFYPAFTGAEMARRSEELGFDFQMFSENHTRVPDCLGEMRDAIRSTERIASCPVETARRLFGRNLQRLGTQQFRGPIWNTCGTPKRGWIKAWLIVSLRWAY